MALCGLRRGKMVGVTVLHGYGCMHGCMIGKLWQLFHFKQKLPGKAHPGQPEESEGCTGCSGGVGRANCVV